MMAQAGLVGAAAVQGRSSPEAVYLVWEGVDAVIRGTRKVQLRSEVHRETKLFTKASALSVLENSTRKRGDGKRTRGGGGGPK